MNRRYKFKAYVLSYKKWTEPFSFQETITLVQEDGGYNPPSEDMVIVQNIGEKDYLGKEIYEMDLIEELRTGDKYSVIWANEYRGWVLNKTDGSIKNSFNPKEYIVVGTVL